LEVKLLLAGIPIATRPGAVDAAVSMPGPCSELNCTHRGELVIVSAIRAPARVCHSRARTREAAAESDPCALLRGGNIGGDKWRQIAIRINFSALLFAKCRDKP
jgi:hypothetical protein